MKICDSVIFFVDVLFKYAKKCGYYRNFEGCVPF